MRSDQVARRRIGERISLIQVMKIGRDQLRVNRLGNRLRFVDGFTMVRFVHRSADSFAWTVFDALLRHPKFLKPLTQRRASFSGEKLCATKQQFQITVRGADEMSGAKEHQSLFDKRQL